jgi:hypothetical protein
MYRKQLDRAKIDAALLPFNFKDGVRAEELDVETLVKLSNAMRQLFPDAPPSAATQPVAEPADDQIDGQISEATDADRPADSDAS